MSRGKAESSAPMQLDYSPSIPDDSIFRTAPFAQVIGARFAAGGIAKPSGCRAVMFAISGTPDAASIVCMRGHRRLPGSPRYGECALRAQPFEEYRPGAELPPSCRVELAVVDAFMRKSAKAEREGAGADRNL